MDQLEKKIQSVESIVRSRMSGQQAGHDVGHVQRVANSAVRIHSAEGGDRAVILLAAWLHDVGDAKFHDGVERSGEMARQILGDLRLSAEIISHVATIVDNLSFRKRDCAEELSWEGKIVQDADRLDALGAVGIVRTIEYGAAIGQPFYLAENERLVKTGIEHFDDKLFRLRGLLNTETARQIAEQREEFMRVFLRQFYSETGQSEASE